METILCIDHIKKETNVFFLYKDHFGVTWKTEGVSILRTTDDVKRTAELHGVYVNQEIVNAHRKFFFPTKLEVQMNNETIHSLQPFSREMEQ